MTTLKKTLIRFVITACCLYIPATTMAWGQLGHRIVGEIADFYLSKKARKGVDRFIGPSNLAMESNWMDFIKSDPNYRYLYNWHFVNFARDLSYPQVQEYLAKDTTTNVYTRINFIKAELRKKDIAPEVGQMYIRVLTHLVGDLHQPMHVGHAEDSGGNGVKVEWFGRNINLHSLWDSELIEFQQLSYTEYAHAINHPTSLQVQTWQKDELTKWVFESYTLADELYKEAEKNSKYSYKYNFDHIRHLDQQLLKGGVRLAALLNEIFA
jgi:hypothetical protein